MINTEKIEIVQVIRIWNLEFLEECSVFSVQEGQDDVKLSGYIEPVAYSSYRRRYKECILMLNSLEKSLEKHLSAGSMADGLHRGDHPS